MSASPLVGREPWAARALLAVVAVVLTAWALKASVGVTMPLVFAAFVVALFAPVNEALSRKLPRGIAVVSTTLLFAGALAGLAAAFVVSGEQVADYVRAHESGVASAWESARGAMSAVGVDLASIGTSDLSPLVKRASTLSVDVLTRLVLVVAFVGLGLYEIPHARRKVEAASGAPERMLEVASETATQMRRYFLVRTAIGLLTGALCALGAWAIGLDLWWLWGILNFLLNYIPTLGSILGIVPPVAFAAIQPGGDLELALMALGVVGGVQLVMGNWIDPLVQGKYLALSPLVVLASVTLWGYLWGVAGALLGVPLTIVAVLVCRELEATRWLATALTRTPEDLD